MKTEYEKCLAGESFIGGKDPKIVETILRTRRLLAQFNATDYADTERKQALLRSVRQRVLQKRLSSLHVQRASRSVCSGACIMMPVYSVLQPQPSS